MAIRKSETTIDEVCTWEGRPTKTLLLTIVTIVVTEMLIHTLLKELSYSVTFSIEILIDVILMLFVLFPLLYTQVLNPLLRQISLRRQTEHSLLQANNLLQKTISCLNEAVFIVNTQNRRITEVNSCAERMFGYTRDELLGAQTSLLHLNTEMYQMFGSEMLLSYQEMGYFETQYKMRRKDGTVFHSEHFVAPITDENGDFQCHVCVVRDISGRKQMEESLANSERFLNTIIATEPECIKLLDGDNNLLMMNRAGLNMIQADSFEQVKGRCVSDIVTEPYRESFIELTKRVFQGYSGTLRFEAFGLKGRQIWLETHAVPFRNEHGDITALLGITRDITERHQSEQALESAYLQLAERKSFIESIISNLQSGLIITDLNQQIVMTNTYVQELTKLTDSEITGMALADFCPAIAAQINSGIKSSEIPISFNATDYTIGFTSIDLKDANNEITGMIINFRDLSEIVKIRAKVHQKERLTAMGEVVAGVAHEMRNPLFGMTTVGQILAMELDLSPQHRQLMDSFMHESRRLNNLVQDLLDGTRELKLRKKPVLLSRIIESATCICQQALQNKAITLKWEKPSNEPQVLADPEKLEQVLVNLIHNAIEANDRNGSIEITLEADSQQITCTVTDSGHGIPENIMGNIFDVFFTSKKSGTGMGLSISRNIAEAHHGTLEAVNLPENGAKFTMQLPLGGDQP